MQQIFVAHFKSCKFKIL